VKKWEKEKVSGPATKQRESGGFGWVLRAGGVWQNLFPQEGEASMKKERFSSERGESRKNMAPEI